MGTELVGGIVGMLLVGFLLDLWLGTKPWLAISGALLGLLAGGYNFIRRALKENRDSIARFKAEHPEGLAPLPEEDEDEEEWEEERR